MRRSRKAQGAMEYVTSYGFAILIIIGILSALFILNVFKSPGIGTSSCLANAGYQCGNPIMDTSGFLSVDFSQVNQLITITGLGCVTGSSPPTTFTSTNIATDAGKTVRLKFQCPISAAGQLGATFSGTLWVVYTAQGRSYTTPFATAMAVATVQAAVSVLANVPITITNYQGTATPAPFQQQIVINSANYQSFINAGWSNVEFTDGPAGTGNLLQAWVETNPSNLASSTTVWVNLPSGIPAVSNVIIYMNFMSGNVMSSSGPTGEAPQLSSTFGQYDNGGGVFNVYGGATWTNFAGYGGGTWTTSGGALQQTSSSSLGILTGPVYVYTGSTYAVAGSYVIESLLNYPSVPTGINPRVGVVSIITPFGGDAYGYRFIFQQGSSGPGALSFLNDLIVWVNNQGYQTSTSTDYLVSVSDAIGVWSGTLYQGGSVVATLPATFYLSANQRGQSSGYIGVSASVWSPGVGSVYANPLTVYWFRTRAYPPIGVMPSVAFGPVH